MRYARLLKSLSVARLQALILAKKRQGKVGKLQRQRVKLARALARLDRKIARMSGERPAPGRRGRKRRVSAAARARMAAAQKARWEKWRKEKGGQGKA